MARIVTQKSVAAAVTATTTEVPIGKSGVGVVFRRSATSRRSVRFFPAFIGQDQRHENSNTQQGGKDKSKHNHVVNMGSSRRFFKVLTTAVTVALGLGGVSAHAGTTHHCFFDDTNLGYILEPDQGMITIWGGVVPQALFVRVLPSDDVLMRAEAKTVIRSNTPAPEFLPFEVTEQFRLTADTLMITTTWDKIDGTDFPSYFEPTDFAPEPFVPGEWTLSCDLTD
jgi:hypothetical protein